MLPLAVVEEVRRLLDEKKLSQRKIAQKLQVSRGTVGAIASGKRGIYGREPSDESPELSCMELPPERCDGCGATVYKPCVLCRARDYEARQKLLDLLSRSKSSPPRRVA
ncbi:MAG: helix-turn-helix transcriptional regulator [Planctomycetota bacterium]